MASGASSTAASATSAASVAGSATLTAAPPTASAAPRVATVKPFEPSFPVPAFKGAFPHPADPSVNEAGRMVDMAFARPGPEKDIAPLFTLTNRSGKKIRVNQTWLFYFDAAGKQLDRYPSSLGGSLVLEPGESKETRLGPASKDQKPGTVGFEGEVTSAYFGDEPWFNENLIEDRPKGGHSPDELTAMAGERVVVDVYGLHAYKVRLTNITDRPVKELSVTFLYFDAKGRVDKGVWASFQKVPLKPGESLDVTLKPSFDKDKAPPPKAVSVVAYASRVEFSEGPTFHNKNLDSEARRLPAKAGDKPAARP